MTQSSHLAVCLLFLLLEMGELYTLGFIQDFVLAMQA